MKTWEKIKADPLTAVLLGAFLAWMGWISLCSYQAISIDKVNSVLHSRITNTKQELVKERDKEIADLKKRLDRLEEKQDKLIFRECPDDPRTGSLF